MHKLHLVVFSGLLAGSTLAQAPTKAFRFDWPTNARATVTEVRQSDGRNGQTVTFRYDVHIETKGKQRRLRFGNVDVLKSRFNQEMPAVVRKSMHHHTIRRMRPTITFDDRGKVVSIVDFNEAVDSAITSLDGQRRSLWRKNARKGDMRSVVEGRQRLTWQIWVGRWIGLPVRKEALAKNVKELFPNGKRMPARITASTSKLQSGQYGIRAKSVLDAKAAIAELKAAGMDVKAFSFVTTYAVDLDPKSMLPHKVVVERKGKMTPRRGKPEPVREKVSWTFEWQKDVAAPTRR